jgi:hypothetical protein
VHCQSPDCEIAKREFMFPFATVVQCPQADLLRKIGPTLVGTVITKDETLIAAATDATNIDRLNIGPDSDHPLELAATARRQYHRFPVPLAGLPTRRIPARNPPGTPTSRRPSTWRATFSPDTWTLRF